MTGPPRSSRPASRIDIIGTGITRTQPGGRDADPAERPGHGRGRSNVKPPNGATEREPEHPAATTLAVNTEEALLIRMCETANVRLSFILRSEECADIGELDQGFVEPRTRWSKWLQDKQDRASAERRRRQPG